MLLKWQIKEEYFLAKFKKTVNKILEIRANPNNKELKKRTNSEKKCNISKIQFTNSFSLISYFFQKTCCWKLDKNAFSLIFTVNILTFIHQISKNNLSF